jgi:AAA+ ATPase superfamily predicted ATPase
MKKIILLIGTFLFAININITSSHKGEEVDIALLNPQEKKAIIAEAKWRKMTPKDIEKTRLKATLKAKNILPKSYRIKKTIIAVKQVDGTTPEDTLIPEDLDKEIKC